MLLNPPRFLRTLLNIANSVHVFQVRSEYGGLRRTGDEAKSQRLSGEFREIRHGRRGSAIDPLGLGF